MAVFDDKVVQARRNGVAAVAVGKELCGIDGSVSVQDVTHAFAIAGYPPSDTIAGVSTYLRIAGRESAENFQATIEKMREVGYPENEIQDALNQAKG